MNTITIKNILKQKGYGFNAIGPEAIVYDALGIMAEKNIGALPVVENGVLIGVFSERDYARKVILKGKSSKNTTVRELMSSPPISVEPAVTLRDCMVLMTKNRVRHLPVVDGGIPIGVVSIGDVVNTIISDQAATIEELEEYIAGTGYRA